MSLSERQVSVPQYMTRTEFIYAYRISYSVVADRVRRGEIALHFIDNKIRIEVEEALKACEPKIKRKSNILPMVRKDLFA